MDLIEHGESIGESISCCNRASTNSGSLRGLSSRIVKGVGGASGELVVYERVPAAMESEAIRPPCVFRYRFGVDVV